MFLAAIFCVFGRHVDSLRPIPLQIVKSPLDCLISAYEIELYQFLKPLSYIDIS